MTYHIYGRRKSRHRKLLLDLEAVKIGECQILPMRNGRVHRLQSVLSYHFVAKTFKTHYIDGKLFILRVR